MSETFGSRQGVRKLWMTGLVAFAFAAALIAAPSATAAPLFPQCPPVGANDGCAILIVVDANGNVSVQQDPNPPNNGPYDGADDTLVGLQNNATFAVASINLSSTTLPIFGFDGDGLCTVTPGPPGCPSGGFGPTGYEGPNNTFSSISTDEMSGTVNFTNAIAPGGSAYFGLEDALTAADIIPGTVTSANPPATVAQNPPCGLRIARARVFVFSVHPRLRLVARYRSDEPADVVVNYTAVEGGNKVPLGTVKRHFERHGLFRLGRQLSEQQAASLRDADSFIVHFKIPGEPGLCAREYTRKLTQPRVVDRQRVVFQSDSKFPQPGAGHPEG
jgi:hypothetical protein